MRGCAQETTFAPSDGETTRLVSGVAGERLLRGEAGSIVQLSLLRGSTQEPYDIELTRELIEPPLVSHELLDDAVGYIRIPSFAGDAASQLATAVERLSAEGAARLLIDVRSVAGDPFDAGIEAARLFVPSGTLLLRTEQGDVETRIDATAGSAAIQTPITLLTDYGTAHAAELFVAALHGTGRADHGRTTHVRARQPAENHQASGRHRNLALVGPLSAGFGRSESIGWA